MTQIIPGVLMVDNHRRGLAYVIVDDGITVVDTSMPGSEKAILKTVKGLGYGPSDIKRIIITHGHPDHIGGLRALRDATKATVMAGEADADVIEGKMPMPIPKMRWPLEAVAPLFMRTFAKVPHFRRDPAPVDRRLRDGDVIPVLDGLVVVGLPGHTRGHIGLYSPSRKLLFSADALRMKGDEFIKPLNYGAEKAMALASIKKIAALDCEIMLSGHNKPIMAGAAKKVAAYAEKLDRDTGSMP